MNKSACWMLTLGVAALLLAGCAGGGAETTKKRSKEPEKTPFSVVLDGYAGPENVGLLMAEERGYFADIGLDVSITRPVAPDFPPSYVSSRVSDLGVVHQPQVALAGEEGNPIVAVGSLIPRPTAALIWLRESKIQGLADLKGKTIGVLDLRFQRLFLREALAEVGLTLDDVNLKRIDYQLVPALVRGHADAIVGFRNLEGAELAARGSDPVITPLESLGIPNYEELVVVARADRLADDPRLIRDFMSALARGTAEAIEDPQAALEVIRGNLEANYRSSPKATEAALEATLPLLSRTGYMDPGQASRLLGWMHRQGMIRREPPASALVTNRYLAP